MPGLNYLGHESLAFWCTRDGRVEQRTSQSGYTCGPPSSAAPSGSLRLKVLQKTGPLIFHRLVVLAP